MGNYEHTAVPHRWYLWHLWYLWYLWSSVVPVLPVVTQVHRAVGIQHMSSAPKAWAEASKTMLSWGETGWAGRVLDPDSPVCWIGKNPVVPVHHRYHRYHRCLCIAGTTGAIVGVCSWCGGRMRAVGAVNCAAPAGARVSVAPLLTPRKSCGGRACGLPGRVAGAVVQEGNDVVVWSAGRGGLLKISILH
jgi:hypothetical protein